MRDAMASDAAQAEPEEYTMLLQRFLFLQWSEPETAAFQDRMDIGEMIMGALRRVRSNCGG